MNLDYEQLSQTNKDKLELIEMRIINHPAFPTTTLIITIPKALFDVATQ
jgi:hypothetical protein